MTSDVHKTRYIKEQRKEDIVSFNILSKLMMQ